MLNPIFFIIEVLLVQRRLQSAYLNNKSWRTRQTNRIKPAYLMEFVVRIVRN
jgi:hypothetical protein